MKKTQRKALKFFNLRSKDADQLKWDANWISLEKLDAAQRAQALGPDANTLGTLTDPREFNLMFKTYVGALSGEEGAAFPPTRDRSRYLRQLQERHR